MADAQRMLRERAEHIAQALAHIDDFMEGIQGPAQLQADAKTRMAVERGLEIVSEAANYIRKGKHGLLFDDDFANELQASVGNMLRHEYEVVEAHTIWQVVTEMLPIVKKRVEILLREGVLDQMPDTNDWRKLRGRGVKHKPSG